MAENMYYARIVEPCLNYYKKHALIREKFANDMELERYISDKKDKLCIKEKVIIPRIVVIVSTKCSLKCENCSNLMPFYDQPYDNDVEQVIEDMEKFLEVVDEIIEVEVIGGEPFIYKDLDKLLLYLLNNEKLDYIELTTNGMQIPDDKILKILFNDKIKVNISDYGNINILSKFVSALDKHHIKSTCHSVMQWVDCGGTEQRNRNDEKLTKIYLSCGSGKTCKTILKGKLFDCSRAAHLYDLGYAGDIEYLDLYQLNSSEEVIEFYTKRLSHACNYCDFMEEPLKYIEPAVQSGGVHIPKSEYTIINRQDLKRLEDAKEYFEKQAVMATKENTDLNGQYNELKAWTEQLEEGKKWLETQYLNYKKLYEDAVNKETES